MATISVIIPTCNPPQHPRQALDSVPAQTRKPESVIAVDDGDGAAEQARRTNLDAMAGTHGLPPLELKSHRSVAEKERPIKI